MATGLGMGGQLVYMAGLVLVLLFIVKGMRPAKLPRRRSRISDLGDYRSGFAGLVVVGVLLPGILGPSRSVGALTVAIGLTLGLVAVSTKATSVASVVVAALGLVMVCVHMVTFLVQRRDTGTLETIFNLSVFVLICCCFLAAAMAGTLFAALPWGGGLGTHALTFVIVLELLMLLAAPAWDVLHTMGPLRALTSVGIACGVAVVLGLFSHPAVLDLLAVGFAITLAVYGADLKGPRLDLTLVVVGIVLAFVVRSLVRILCPQH